MQTPEGYSLERTDETLRAIEARLAQAAATSRHLLTTIGDTTGRLRAGEGTSPPARSTCASTELDERDSRRRDVMKQARAILADVSRPARQRAERQPASSSGGQRFSDIEFDLTGPSLEQARELSPTRSWTGMRADAGLRRRRHHALGAQARAAGRRSTARRRRTSASTCATSPATLRTLVGGEPVSKYREEHEQYDVWLRAERRNRNDPRAIGDVHHRVAARRAGAARQPGHARARSAARRRSTASTASAR